MSWNNLGNWARTQGRMDESADFYRRSLEIKDRIGDQHGSATTLFNMASVDFARGDLVAAEACLHRALEINQRLGDQQGVADCYYNLAEITLARGDYGLAEEQHLRSLAIVERLGDQVGLVYAWNNLGGLARERGDLQAATRYFRRARRGARRLDDVVLEGYALLGLADVCLRRTQDGTRTLRAAGTLLKRVRAVAEDHGLAELLARVGLTEAELHLLRGDVDRARTAAMSALDLARAGDQRLEEAQAYQLLGRCAIERGEAVAEQHLNAALAVFERSGAAVEAARTQHLLAETLAYRATAAGVEVPDAARVLLGEARAVFAARGVSRDLRQAERVLARWDES
jgi:tetratricopeptide (TPR) repeat protein